MLVCLSAAGNVLGLCLKRFPCQTPLSQDQQLTRSRASGRWRLCGVGCNGNAPGGGHKSTESPGNTAKPDVLLQGKLLSFSKKGLFKLKDQILLYELILDQENHKLLHAKHDAPPEQGVQVQCIHCQAAAQTREVPEIQEIHLLSPCLSFLYLAKERLPKFNLYILSCRQHMERREKNPHRVFSL